jgi:hypothetical protein
MSSTSFAFAYGVSLAIGGFMGFAKTGSKPSLIAGVGSGITPFLKIMALGEFKQRKLAPHFAMEIHLHLAAAYGLEPWLEHFEWLGPLFNEQMHLQNGRMHVSSRLGLGFSLSEQARRWTRETAEFGREP